MYVFSGKQADVFFRMKYNQINRATMSEVSGIELEKDAAGNNSYVRIDLKKYGDMINPILQRSSCFAYCLNSSMLNPLFQSRSNSSRLLSDRFTPKADTLFEKDYYSYIEYANITYR